MIERAGGGAVAIRRVNKKVSKSGSMACRPKIQTCQRSDGWTWTTDELKSRRNIQEAYPLLENLPKRHITDLLTFIASQSEGDGRPMEHMVKFLRMKGASLDARDSHGRTALETAVRAGNIDGVSILLTAGASVDVENKEGQTPLEVLLGIKSAKETDIGAILLVNGASFDPDFSYHLVAGRLDGVAHTNRYQEWNTDPTVLGYCLSACHRSFGKNLQSNEHHGAYRTFLQTWRHSISLHPDIGALASRCLELFLILGCDPFVPEIPALPCPVGQCTSLAAHALYHIPNVPFADVILQHSARRYIPRLVSTMLQPCQWRTRGEKDKPLPTLLRTVVSKRCQEVNVQGLVEMLRGRNSKDPEVTDFIAVLEQLRGGRY